MTLTSSVRVNDRCDSDSNALGRHVGLRCAA
jgi:hypothetical protein